MTTPYASEELTQIAMYELVRQLAATLAALAVHDDRYVALPNVGDVLVGEIADQLAARGLPAKVAADLLGISRRSFFRVRRFRAEFRPSHVGELVVLLTDGPLSKEQLLVELGHDERVASIESALRFLLDRQVLEIDEEGRYALRESGGGDVHDDVEHYLESIAGDYLPITIADLAAELGQDLAFVRRVVQNLERAGRLELAEDRIVASNAATDLIATTHRTTILGLLYTARALFGALRGRLDGGRASARILTWSFATPPVERLEAIFERFCASLDSEWETLELDNRTDRPRYTMLAGWLRDRS